MAKRSSKTPVVDAPAPEANGTPPAPEPTSNGVKKTKCPVSKSEFLDKAPRSLAVTIQGVPLIAEVKEFSTGSFGYYLNGKMTLDVGGTPVSFQIGMNLTAVGSKEAAE